LRGRDGLTPDATAPPGRTGPHPGRVPPAADSRRPVLATAGARGFTGRVASPRSVTAAGADGLDAIRKSPSEAVLGFDFDGTLAPIVDDPAAARAHPGAAPALARLAPLVGALVIVTGRPAAVAVEYGGFEDVEGLVVLGQYGLGRWGAGGGGPPEAVRRAAGRVRAPAEHPRRAGGAHRADAGARPVRAGAAPARDGQGQGAALVHLRPRGAPVGRAVRRRRPGRPGRVRRRRGAPRGGGAGRARVQRVRRG